jgi:hypothetical protein
MKENVGFSEALDHMKKGGTIALPKWSSDVYISMQRPDAYSKMTHPYLYVTSRFGCVPWIPTQVELLSEQWILIEG